MLIDFLLGRKPSHFHLNPFVKIYILSESLMWSSWNFITPIFAIFVVNNVSGGNIQIAGLAYSVYLLSRVVFELISGRILIRSSNKRKVTMTIGGLSLMSLAYSGFALTTTIPLLFLFYVLMGVGMGLSTPARVSLFSVHLDKNKESSEWSIADAVQFSAMALSGALGGFIAGSFGFSTLFIISAIVNLLSIIPYLLKVDIFNSEQK